MYLAKEAFGLFYHPYHSMYMIIAHMICTNVLTSNKMTGMSETSRPTIVPALKAPDESGLRSRDL